jgi:hypothetical protein
LAQVHRLNVDITIVAHHCLIKISSRAWHVCLLLWPSVVVIITGFVIILSPFR